MKQLAMVYGMACYAIFIGTFLYAIGFVGNFAAPKTIDSGAETNLTEALIWNLALLTVFAVQHSLMARPAFKNWWTRMVPKPVERSTYVVFASLALILIFWQWRPILDPVWNIQSSFGVLLLQGIFWLGWVTVLVSTFLISHFELFGLRQVWLNLIGAATPTPEFKTPLLYGFVRHPIYLGFILAFWATPQMSAGHLLFAAGTTVYILTAIQLEERDLVRLFGEKYTNYRKRVSMLVPLPSFQVRTQPTESEHKPIKPD